MADPNESVPSPVSFRIHYGSNIEILDDPVYEEPDSDIAGAGLNDEPDPSDPDIDPGDPDPEDAVGDDTVDTTAEDADLFRTVRGKRMLDTLGLTNEASDSIHSIKFELGESTTNKKDTWKNWHLVPTQRPYVAPPEPKLDYVEIPGNSRALDYTDMIGGVNFNRRTGSWEFIAIPDGNSMVARYSEVMTFLGGRAGRVILRDDPNYYYYGRVWVSGWQSGRDVSTVTINYNLDPYKYKISDPGVTKL